VTQHLHVVLLAGGTGTRFWPLSRASRPKQMLRLFGTRSLLQATWDRARLLAPASRVWLIAPRSLKAAIRRQLPALRADRTVLEPSSKGTAAAVGLACRAVASVEPSAVVAVLPTDHVVADARAFARSVTRAARAAGTAGIVCLGVKPDRGTTGFGYLELAAAPRGLRTVRVRRFVEKPSSARAARFARSKHHLWNAGVVVGRAGTILDELRRHAPRIHRGVTAERTAAWKAVPRGSFDRAVLEKTDRLAAVPLDAGWADVGSWDAAAAHAAPRRRGKGPILLGSPGAAVFGNGRVVALVDVPGVVVVDTPDAVLVVARASAERVREAVARIARVAPEVVR
jgi:mannose-1-phosphate guanylyltransferase/mannose-6-phosphate isomerase